MSRLNSAVRRIVRAQTRTPWRFLLIGLCFSALAAIAVANLRLDTSYEALLPQGAPEIQNLDKIREQTGGTRKLVIAISGGEGSQRIEFGRDLVKRLEPLETIRFAEFERPVEFFQERAIWFSDADELAEILPAWKQAQKLSCEEGDIQALGLAWSRLRDELQGGPDGSENSVNSGKILNTSDGRYSLITVVPSVNLYDFQQVQELHSSIAAIVDGLDPETSGLEVRYAGNVYIGLEQQGTMVRDLRHAAIVALVFGILFIAGFTRRLTSPVVIGVALISGVLWAFAMAWVLFQHLNVITGFLIAVLIGLGLDFGIHLYVRFRQEARSEGSIADVMERTVLGTARPALTSALTTSATFFTFAIADFRGFSEFGVIAGCGVLCAFLSTFLIVPPMLALSERYFPSRKQFVTKRTIETQKKPIPWPVAGIVCVFFGAFACYGAVFASDIPFRNDFRELSGHSEAAEFTDYINAELDVGLNPAVVVVKSIEQAQHVEQIVAQRSDEISQGEWGVASDRVLSIADLLPDDVEQKSVLIEEFRSVLSDSCLDNLVADRPDMAEQLDLGRRMMTSSPWTISDIPDVFRRPFLTLDSSQYLVYIWPARPNTTDERAVAWQAELNELEDRFQTAGISAQIADETLIHAWVNNLVLSDGIRLIIISFLMVFIILLLDLRSFKSACIVILPLVVGMGSFVGLMRIFGLEFNLFNIIVLPCIVGIGIDSSVHIFHRYKTEGAGSEWLVIRRTGSAIFLASVTTGIGFGASLISHHVGLRSMGFIAVLGMMMTFVSSVIFFPCFLSLIFHGLIPRPLLHLSWRRGDSA